VAEQWQQASLTESQVFQRDKQLQQTDIVLASSL